MEFFTKVHELETQFQARFKELTDKRLQIINGGVSVSEADVADMPLIYGLPEEALKQVVDSLKEDDGVKDTCKVTPIEWKEGKNPCFKLVKRKQKKAKTGSGRFVTKQLKQASSISLLKICLLKQQKMITKSPASSANKLFLMLPFISLVNYMMVMILMMKIHLVHLKMVMMKMEKMNMNIKYRSTLAFFLLGIFVVELCYYYLIHCCYIELIYGLPEEALKQVVDGLKEDDGVKGVPDFWLHALQNCPTVEEMIEEVDLPILKHLKNIESELTKEPMGFILRFTFEENEYFSNTVIDKTYYYKLAPSEAPPHLFDGPIIGMF
uniref:Uncharacterized protein n=1 Tax=Panagrolaimus sp. ES5 TaxID=591445 RepID=A0AC34FXS9_9BILA